MVADATLINRRILDPERDAEIDAYQCGRRYLFDHEAQAYAIALKWDGDEYSDDGGIVIPDPADAATDCALIPDRFRYSFDRLPAHERAPVARLYRRTLIYRAVTWGLTSRPLNLTITAAAGIEFDTTARAWKSVGPLHLGNMRRSIAASPTT